MAEFCNQCAKKLSFELGHFVEPGDFANIKTLWDELANTHVVVLCEGCGLIEVDRKGNRIKKLTQSDEVA